MFRQHESPDKVKAGALALLVHLVLLGGMLISFNWKSAHQILNVTEVELWDRLPASKATPRPAPEPKPVIEEKPEPKPEPKPPEQEKPVVQEKPEPKPEPKAEETAEIELEKKKRALAEKQKQEEAKRLEEKKLAEKKLVEQKKQAEREKLLQAMRDEDLVKADKADSEALKKLQAEVSGESSEKESAAKSAANTSLVGEYTDKIKAKIRGNVNKALCGGGNPELRFEIAILPTGELKGAPKLTKSSGNAACDEAVERAIMASEPLPVPTEASVFVQFRNMTLKFRPND